MHITVRRLIFAFFVLVFVVTAPLVVLYTAGYRLNISNRHLQQTGVLAITTFPRGASIVLNGQSLAQKSPYVVQHVMPNTHDIRLEKKGYHTWSQRVRVDEGRTAYVTARLFADSVPVLLNAADSALALRARDHTSLITVSPTVINFANNGANIEVRNGSDATAPLIALLPLGDYRTLEQDPEYILVADAHNGGFVIARQGGQVVQLPTAVNAYDWLSNENLLLWTDGSEVNIYEADTGTNTFVTRESQNIVDVAWQPEADSFFVASSTAIDAYDITVHETREVTPLLSGATIADIWLDAAGKNLYYLDTPLAPGSATPPLVHDLPLTL